MKYQSITSSSVISLARNGAALLGVASILAFSAGSTDVNGSIITLDQLNQTAALGDLVTVDVRISGLTPPETVGNFEFMLYFDPNILAFDNIVFGDPILGDQLAFITPSANHYDQNEAGGNVIPVGTSLDPASVLDAQQPDSFVLTSITLKTVGLGTSPVGLNVLFFGGPGPDYGPLIDPEVGEIGSVTVTTNVPEGGSTAALLAVSVFFVGLFSTQYRRTSIA